MPDRAIPPTIGDFQDIHLQFPPQITLSNGIKAWVVGHGEDELCRLSWFFPGGKFNEPKTMLASLTASTLFDGSKSFTASQVAEALDFYGAWCHSQAYELSTLAEMMSLNDTLTDVIAYYIDGVLSPTFPEEAVAHKRNLIVGNLENMMQKVRYLASREMARLYYGEAYPLARSPKPHEIEQLQAGQLSTFHQECSLKYLGSSQLIIAGHITDRELRIIDDGIGQLPLGDTLVPPEVSLPIVHDTKRISFVDKPGTVQSAIRLTLEAVPRTHKDYLKLRLLVVALGGYFGSRLMQNIREDKGYTYGIGAVLAGRTDEAHIEISTECANRYTVLVINEIKNELQRLKDFPLGYEELQAAKQSVLSDLVKTLDTPLSIADYVKNTITFGVYPDYFNRQVTEVIAATPADLQELACRYFDLERLWIVVAGDKKQIGNFDFSC